MHNKEIPFVRKLYLKVKNLWYKGNLKYCPCCDGSFRRFLPHVYRKSAMCPKCGSLERHRLMVLYLRFKTDYFSKKAKVLHFSPHAFLQKKFMEMPNLEYVSVDLNSSNVMYNMDITELLFKDNNFDCILCYHILEHVKNDNLALRELFRVLKPEGWAIIQTVVNPNLEKTFEDPNIIEPKDRTIFYGHKDHLRIYGTDFKNKLENAGFTVKVDLLTHNKKLINYFGIYENETIYYCTKK